MSEPLSSTSEYTPTAADTHLSTPHSSQDHSKPLFVSGVRKPLPSAQHGDSGNDRQSALDSAPSSPDPSAHGSEEKQLGESTDEGDETTPILQDINETQRETDSSSTLTRKCKHKGRIKWCIIILLMLMVPIVGISIALGIKCSPHTPYVSHMTRVISENSTVSLGDLPYDRVNITALDAKEYHHTTEIYHRSCGTITNKTSHIHACSSYSFSGAEAFPLDNPTFMYTVRDSVWEYVVSVSHALNDGRIMIVLFDNKGDSRAFMSNKTVSGSLFNQSLIVVRNGTTFPPLSFTVPVDSYIFPDASVTVAMNISICKNLTLISYNKLQNSAVCTIQSRTDYCDINIAKDTCLYAYTDVEEFAQKSDLTLKLQGTREATPPNCCTTLYVFAAVLGSLLFLILILMLLLYIYTQVSVSVTQNAT